MPTKRGYRLILAALVVVSAIGLVQAHGLSSPASDEPVDADNVPVEVPPREGITVVSTDSNVWLSDDGAGPRQSSELVAYDPDGDLLYHNGTHDRYWDVDPSPQGERTVLYTASEHLDGAACNASTVCTRNVIERINLTTDEVTTLYERVTPLKHSTRWHDVDRVGESQFAVADIYRDRLFVIDTETGMMEWTWEAQQSFGPGSGGPFPRDWTHVNDVEVLDDGRYMASLRNQDQVVFVDPEEGLQEEWTLGSEDEYDVLHEQHNPDFIPEENGGPAVLVADSENNRIVEYQRVGGEWERSWTWADAGMQWARDADRLPNGNTLVADSNGDRVFEVGRDGDVVWSIDIAFPYEVERLETGDESAGGESAASLDLTSQTAESSGEHTQAGFVTQTWLALKGVIPGPILNGIVYVLPGWFGAQAVLSTLVLVGSLFAWLVLEWRWRSYSVTIKAPVELTRERE